MLLIYRFPLFLIFAFYFLLSSCSNSEKHTTHPARTITPAFYFWKSTWQPTAYEKQKLDSLKVNNVYLKYFDVDWNAATHQPMPVAMIRFKEKPAYTITPVVFITNECLQQMDTSQINNLADKIITSIASINTNNSIDNIEEIQIDCDWSANTKNKYFALLNNIKESFDLLTPVKDRIKSTRAVPSLIQLSCTIRLHQVKFKDQAGIPPVDKGLLMCYNMGNLKSPDAENSIIDLSEFKKYTRALSNYPLDLDVALPIFDWKVWFRDGRYHGITEEFPDSLLMSPVFTKKNNRYQINQDTILAGYDFKKGDLLRYETSQLQAINDIASDVSDHLKNTRCKVALYHLDAVLLKKYSAHELENIYNSLR